MTKTTDTTTPEDYGAELAVDATLDLSLTRDNAPADGTSTNVAMATITNDGDLVGDVLIDFQITGGSAVFTDTGTQTVTKKTNPLLMASAQFTDTVGESGTISATVHLRASLTKEVAYRFSPTVAKNFVLTLTPTRDGATADGTDFDTVTAKLVDEKGAPAAGQMLVFTVSGSPSASFRSNGQQSLSLATGSQGTVSADIVDNSNKSESVTVFCALKSDARVNDHTTVQFKAATVTGRKLLLVPTKDRAPANGTDRNRVTATYLNADETPVANESLVFSLDKSAIATFINGKKSTTALTDQDGKASAALVDKANRRDVVTVACSPANDANINATTPVVFKAPSAPPGDLELDLNVLKNFAAADGKAANKVQATVHDGDHKPVADAPVLFSVSPTNNARFTNGQTTITQNTNVGGQVSVSLVDGAQRDDTVQVSAALVSDPGISDSKPVTFRRPVPYATLKLRPTIDNALADGQDVDELTVQVGDADGNPLAGQTVTLSVPAGSARFQANMTTTLDVTTGADGTALARVVDDAGQDDTVVSTGVLASDNTVSDTTPLHFREPGFDLQLAVTKDNASADGKDHDTVTATLTDGAKRPVAGQTLNFSLPSGGSAQLTGGGTTASVVTGSDGTAGIGVTDLASSDTTVSVTCAMAAHPAVSKSIDAHFKGRSTSAIASFAVNGLVTNGKNNDGTPCQVQAVIVPVAGSAAADYIVRFSGFQNRNLSPNFIRITPPGQSSGGTQQEYLVPVTVRGTTTTDAWVHYIYSDVGSTGVQAELLTMDRTHVAYSSPNTTVNFAGTPAPAPTPTPTLPQLQVTCSQFEPRYAPPQAYYICQMQVQVVNGMNATGTFTVSSNGQLIFCAYPRTDNMQSRFNFQIAGGTPAALSVCNADFANGVTRPLTIAYNGTTVWSGTVNPTTFAVTGN